MSTMRTFVRIVLALLAFDLLGVVRGRAEAPTEWKRDLAEHIRCHLVYPVGPGRPSSPRTARVVFTISADGSLSNVNVEQSSGVMVFDRAALAAVENSNPGPPPPVLPGGLPLVVHIPLTFVPPHTAAGMPQPETPKDEPLVCRDVGIM